MAGSSAGGEFSEKRQQQAAAAAATTSTKDSPTATANGSLAVQQQQHKTKHETTNIAWKRRDSESASTEGSLRALLNKLAPNNTLDSLATKVANYLLEDEAPDQLARQLVDRVQNEPLYGSTYAKLSAVLVRMRSGFVFYKFLLCRCRSTFSSSIRSLITENPGQQSGSSSSSNGFPTRSDIRRHRLNALTAFVCHLFLEGLINFEQLHQDFLQLLECHIPDPVAIEGICSALNTAGRSLEQHRQQWLREVMQRLKESLRDLQQNQELRIIFLIKDLVELCQRNWQPRRLNVPDDSTMSTPEP